MTSPKISVVLPAYNSAEFISEAIESILNQTFTDYEFIIIDDGSKDGTSDVVEKFKDQRILLIKQENMGLAKTLNKAIFEVARAPLIARQDHDDISKATRLEKQYQFMRQNPDCVLLGTRAEIWVDDVPSDRFHDHPLEDAQLRFDLMFDNPFVHSSVMFRRETVVAVGGYATKNDRQPEDYELWSRLSRVGTVSNLEERLLIYREMSKSMTRVNSYTSRVCSFASENIAYQAGLTGRTKDTDDIAAILHRNFSELSANPELTEMENLLSKATQNILKAAPISDVKERLEWRLLNLRHHLPEEFKPPELLKHKSRIRRILSKMARKVRSAIKRTK